MKERGKGVEISNTNANIPDFNLFASSSEMPCQKHPNTSPVGICPHCLKDRLVKLVCSECGEQRLSSCSCSDVSSSYRNSCSTMEVGSVGRVSFLIENDKITSGETNPRMSSSKTREREGSDSDHNKPVIFLRRSSSSCVEVKKSKGLWRIKRLFRKKKKKKNQQVQIKGEDLCDEKSEIWVSDIMGVSRCRSLCSFRVGYSDGDEGSEYGGLSSAKISDVTSGIFVDQMSEWEWRKSDFRGGKRGGGGELERAYSVPNRSVFPAKESDFDESGFIDLKLDLMSEARQCDEIENRVNEGGGVKKRGGSKTHKVWKWIFKYHPATKKC